MPVYLCQSGSGFDEPWRHGIQVYAAPFPISHSVATGIGGAVAGGSVATSADNNAGTSSSSSPQWESQQQQQPPANSRFSLSRSQQPPAGTPSAPSEQQQQLLQQQMLAGTPIRRVRHAEIVLVDDVCVAFGRYWLRLRWPGQRAGFAGYIAMGMVSDARLPLSKPSGTLGASFFVVVVVYCLFLFRGMCCYRDCCPFSTLASTRFIHVLYILNCIYLFVYLFTMNQKYLFRLTLELHNNRKIPPVTTTTTTWYFITQRRTKIATERPKMQTLTIRRERMREVRLRPSRLKDRRLP